MMVRQTDQWAGLRAALRSVIRQGRVESAAHERVRTELQAPTPASFPRWLDPDEGVGPHASARMTVTLGLSFGDLRTGRRSQLMAEHKRGLPEPYAEIFFGDRLAVSEAEGAAHGILIWHKCPVEGGWVAAGVGLHTKSGPDLQHLTLRNSLKFDCCGMHGFLTDGVWVDWP